MRENGDQAWRARLVDLAERLHDIPVTGEEAGERDGLVDLITGYTVPRVEAPTLPLVAAVAGPSGVGKSFLVNALAGATVSAEGVIRPTTTLPVAVAGEPGIAGPLRERLESEGATVTAAPPGRLEGVTVVDLPATSGSAEAAVLADLVLVVVSPARYADASVWDALGALGDAAVPVWLVTNRMAPELEADLTRRLDGSGLSPRRFPLGRRDGDDVDGVEELAVALASASADGAWRAEMLEHRLGRIAAGAAALVDDLDATRAAGAGLLAIAAGHYARVRDGIDGAITSVTSGGGGTVWPAVAERLVALLTHRVGSAAGATAKEWSRDPRGRGLLEGGGAGLWRHGPATDVSLAAALREWPEATEDEVAGALRRRPSPARLDKMAALVRDRALGADGPVPWLVRRRFRNGIDGAVAAARVSLAEAMATVVDEDEARFAAALGPLPTEEQIAGIRGDLAAWAVVDGEAPADA